MGQELELFAEHGVTHLVAIEALEQPFEVLRKNLAIFKNIRSIPVNICLTSVDNKDVDFHVASNFGQSSSILEPTRHKAVYPSVSFSPPSRLIGYSLDSVIKAVRKQSSDFDDPFDMIFIDVQGAEIEVFLGGLETLNEVSTIYTEVTFGTDYDGAPSYLEIIQFLETLNFRCCALEIDPAGIGHGNAIFHRVKFQ